MIDPKNFKAPPKFETPTEEELRERLEKLGVTGKWQGAPAPGKDIPMGDKLTIFKKHAVLLEQLQTLLEAQVEADSKKLDRMREQAERLKHGGGM